MAMRSEICGTQTEIIQMIAECVREEAARIVEREATGSGRLKLANMIRGMPIRIEISDIQAGRFDWREIEQDEP